MAQELTLERALEVVEAARAAAREMGNNINIAVVDEGSNLLAFARMDGSFLGSIDVALGKAHTVVSFQMNTSDLAELVQPGQPLYGIEYSRPAVVTVGGGAPIKNGEGHVIGALGVSGGPVPDDTKLAESVAGEF
jgi:uncharacterized protein GlcG (DUF336 family)